MPPAGGKFRGFGPQKGALKGRIRNTWYPCGSTPRSEKRSDSSVRSPACRSALYCGVTIRQRPPKELHDLYAEINRIGTNINQIARKTNAGFATKDDMRELLFLMKAIEQKMAKVAEQ